MRRARGWLLPTAAATLFVAVSLTAAAPPGHAQSRSSSDIQRDLDEVREESTQLTSQLRDVRGQISTTEEELAQITVRLEDARARLAAAEGQVALAEGALAEAAETAQRRADEHDAAVAELAAAEEQLAVEEQLLHEQLVESFKYGTSGAQRGAMVIEVLRRAENPNDFAVGFKQLRTVMDVQDATVGRVTELRAQRMTLTEQAAVAQDAAQAAADEARDTLAVVEELRAEATAVAAEVAADEDRQRTVLAQLEGTANETSARLQRVADREQELREDLATARARETGASDRSGYSGWAGGPDISGAVCPVDGARAGRDFINDWGYPRSGGRWHQGTDVFGSRGTAVVAVADAVVVRTNPPSRQTSLGGITVTYRTSDGSEWYNAHLDSIAGGIEPGAQVSRGQQIGSVGTSGNARYTPPHLHLGRRYNGDAVNPWPTISGWC
ncbi:MAG: peptidoglycan DD-metalloendopeptidase family protein [Nitriliruptoraceae bacterium]